MPISRQDESIAPAPPGKVGAGVCVLRKNIRYGPAPESVSTAGWVTINLT